MTNAKGLLNDFVTKHNGVVKDDSNRRTDPTHMLVKFKDDTHKDDLLLLIDQQPELTTSTPYAKDVWTVYYQ